MPMHIPSSINTDSSSVDTLLSRIGPIVTPLSPATRNDILGILQREQDHAMSLLSLSPLLSSLFISYAERAAALESAPATPSPESKEWKTLQATIITLREENEKFKLENREMAERLEVVEASQGAFRSQVSSLKEINATQQDNIKSMRAEMIEAKEKYNRLVVDSNAEKAALHVQVLGLEAQRGELKETVVEQQIKISKFERHCPDGFYLPKVTASTGTHRFNIPKDRNTPGIPGRIRSEDEFLTYTEHSFPPTEPASPVLTPESVPRSLSTDSLMTPPQLYVTPKPAPAPVPQKHSGWGSWGGSLLNTVANEVPAPERSPSPGSSKVRDSPRGFTPSRPPKSQPAGFGSLKQPGWGGLGGPGGNDGWGSRRTDPTPITRKPSTGPVRGAKPTGSSFGPGWGSLPNTAGPENIPESAVEIKYVPAPGGFGSVITGKEEAGDI